MTAVVCPGRLGVTRLAADYDKTAGVSTGTRRRWIVLSLKKILSLKKKGEVAAVSRVTRAVPRSCLAMQNTWNESTVWALIDCVVGSMTPRRRPTHIGLGPRGGKETYHDSN